MADRDFHAPRFAVLVNGHKLAADVTDQIVSVSYEHALDMASKLAITVANVDHRYTDSTIFSPGNEVDLLLGYGNALRHVGRGEIVRHLPRYPQDDVPTLDVVGYDRTHRMMRKEMHLDPGKGAGSGRDKRESGVLHKGTVSSVAKALLGRHGIALDLPPAPRAWDRPITAMQKKGTADYGFLRALCNLHALDLSVRWHPGGTPKGTAAALQGAATAGAWRAWLAPAADYRQASRYTFRYGQGDRSSLLSVGLDFGVSQMPTEIQVWTWDRKAGDWALVTAKDAGAKAGKSERFAPARGATPDAVQPATDPTRLKLAVDGHSVEVVADRKFRSAADAAAWAVTWFQRHKDNFVIAKGETIGVEDLEAGQTHGLDGLGVRFSGDYLFSSVKHVFDGDGGYRTEFTARRVLG